MEVRSIEVTRTDRGEPTRYRSIEVRGAIGEVRDHPDRVMWITFTDGSVMRMGVIDIIEADRRPA